MCRYIQGNHCQLGQYCHCHPIRDVMKPGSNEAATDYDDAYYIEQDDTLSIKVYMNAEIRSEIQR